MSNWKFMPGCFLSVRQGCALALLFALSDMHAGAQGDGGAQHPFPTVETLRYSIQWHLINAGTALLRIEPPKAANGPQWEAQGQLQPTEGGYAPENLTP